MNYVKNTIRSKDVLLVRTCPDPIINVLKQECRLFCWKRRWKEIDILSRVSEITLSILSEIRTLNVYVYCIGNYAIIIASS